MPNKRERERERATLWLSNSLPLGESLDFHSTKHDCVELDSTKTPKQESKTSSIDTDGGIYGDTIEDRLSRRQKATKSQDKTQGETAQTKQGNNQAYKVLKAGIIGGGCNSNVGRVHTIALSMDRGFVITSACFSRDRDINTKSNIGINAILYDNYKQLARNALRDGLELIIILTPTTSHNAIINEILSINPALPIICEKTLLTNACEVQELASTHGDAFIATVYNYAFFPMFLELLRHLPRLGTIYHIDIAMPQEGFARSDYKIEGWRLKDGSLPTIFLDLLTHCNHFLFCALNRPPIEVFCSLRSQSGHSGKEIAYTKKAKSKDSAPVIDHASAIYNYGSFDATLLISKVALGHQNGLKIRIYGEKGSLEFIEEDCNHLYFYTQTGEKIVLNASSSGGPLPCLLAKSLERFKVGHPTGYIEGFANFYDYIYAAILEYQSGHKAAAHKMLTTMHLDPAFALNDLQIMEALALSNNSNKMIKIDSTPLTKSISKGDKNS